MPRDGSGRPRRGYLRAVSGVGGLLLTGVVPASATGQASTAEFGSDGRAVGRAPQADPKSSTADYTAVYEETIDAVTLVSVPGTRPGEVGIGSGFVLDDAHLVTNAHVVVDASSVELQFRDEQWRRGTVTGTDLHSDLAVVQVADRPEAAEPLGLEADEPVIGQEVLALGNPLGLDASVSRGIVSGVNRSVPAPSGFSIPATVQTDASVNPGNSGGPLVDLDGDVLGVVFAGAGPGGGGIGFAISSALVDRVVPALIDDGAYEHAYLGVGVAPVGPATAEANDVDEPRGVVVVSVVPDSPAAEVLRPATERAVFDGESVPVGGDVIVAVDGQAVPTEERLAAILALETSPGETVVLDVIRDGVEQTVSVELAARPGESIP